MEPFLQSARPILTYGFSIAGPRVHTLRVQHPSYKLIEAAKGGVIVDEGEIMKAAETDERPPSNLEHAEPQMTLEGVEITIAMKQLVVLEDTEGRDNRIDRRSHRYTHPPQEAVIAG
jgi:hypothetical protein